MMTNAASIHVRVDDRLIHGQVVTVWVKSLNVRHIWVVSNRAAAEPIEVILLKSSVPSHLTLEVYREDEAISAWGRQPVQNLLILTETIQEVGALLRAGLPVSMVDIGGLRYAPGRTAMSKAVYVGEVEVDALMALETFQIPVYIRVLPSDPKVDAFDRIRQRWTSST